MNVPWPGSPIRGRGPCITVSDDGGLSCCRIGDGDFYSPPPWLSAIDGAGIILAALLVNALVVVVKSLDRTAQPALRVRVITAPAVAHALMT